MSHYLPIFIARDIKFIGQALLEIGELVDTGHWQSIKGVPQTKTIEIENAVVEYEIPPHIDTLQSHLQPNLPWAEDHFLERVSGEPLNPGVQYKNWPWYRGNVEQHQTEERFSHTYMERFWPRWVNSWPPYSGKGPMQPLQNRGLRYRLGDLNDVVALLAREPYTRQAVLPVYFPEDTGSHHGKRVPCSLYYHFLLRDGQLNINYTIRSCDFLRHFRDDVYMAARLCQWVLSSLTHMDIPDDQPPHEEWPWPWEGVMPGTLTMMMHSLHIFEGDLPKMEREYG